MSAAPQRPHHAANSDEPDTADGFLSVYLEPFVGSLSETEVTDIYVNRPGEIWVEKLGGEIERQDAPGLTEQVLWRLARQVASLSHQGISRAEPLLSARLPDGSRVQVIAPPATRDGLALAIRRHVSSDLSIDDYVASGSFDETKPGETSESFGESLRALYDRKDWPNLLVEAVRQRKTIVVSGGTSTGKTTFLNALIREIPERERLILIEDTPELILRHENATGLVSVRGELGETRVSSEQLLIASLRMRPDRIILGEIRGTEASTFLRAINTGHPGSLTTIHANSPSHAVEQLALLAGQGLNMNRADTAAYIRSTVDLFVQLAHSQGKRTVASVWMPSSGQGNLA